MKYTIIVCVLFALLSLSQSRTVRWTGVGGTNLWNFARNWDCNCIPTINDDVIIDAPDTPTNVQTGGSSATARSLAVGGSSQYPQSLIVQSQLSVGVGGGRIGANANVILNAAPSLPFSSEGTFNAGSQLTFYSGNIAGSGTWNFQTLNLTSAALKVFSAKLVNILNTLNLNPGTGSVGVVEVTNGTLLITSQATFATSQAATITVSDNANFTVAGQVLYTATSPSQQFTFRGYSTVSNLMVNGGTVVVNDDSYFYNTTIQSGAFLTLIGSPNTMRYFESVYGSGIINIQGGTNSFGSLNVANVNLQSGTLYTNETLNIANLVVSGGVINGSGQINSTSTTLSNSQLFDVALVVQRVTINGFTSFNSASVSVTSYGVVSSSSQFTMSGGSQFTVEDGATISQAAPLKVLPSGSDEPAQLINDGSWSSTSDLTLNINTRGNGTWSLGSGALMTITGISFNAYSLSLSSSVFSANDAVITVYSVQGQTYGEIDFQGRTFFASMVNLYKFVHTQSGNTIFGTATIANLTISGGNVNVTQSGAGQLLNFEGGNLNGGSSAVQYTANMTLLTTTAPKTLNNINVVTTSLNLLCPQSCQLFTNNASITTPQTDDQEE